MKLAQIPTIFGTIAAPTGAPTQLGPLIGLLVNLFILVAGFFLLIYLLMGALDWIVSGGEKEKLSKAQSKITNAIIGIFMVIFALVLFNVIAGQILNIITLDANGWHFNLPTINNQTTPSCSCQAGSCTSGCSNPGDDCAPNPNLCH